MILTSVSLPDRGLIAGGEASTACAATAADGNARHIEAASAARAPRECMNDLWRDMVAESEVHCGVTDSIRAVR